MVIRELNRIAYPKSSTNREVSQGYQLVGWSHPVLLQIVCLDWKNGRPDISERKAEAKKNDPEKKWSRKDSGEDSQWRKDHLGGGITWKQTPEVPRDHYQLRQVTNSWAPAQHELAQPSVPLSQSSSHLPDAEGS